MRDYLQLGLKLLIIALVGGLALGATNAVTEGPIAQQEIAEADAARFTVLPAAESFEKLAFEPGGEYAGIDEVYAGTSGGKTAGYTVKLTVKGFGGDMALTVGVNTDASISGVKVGTHSETPGLGAKSQDESFTAQFNGKPAPLSVVKGKASAGSDIAAITGATITTAAVTDGCNLAVRFVQEQGFLQGGDK